MVLFLVARTILLYLRTKLQISRMTIFRKRLRCKVTGFSKNEIEAEPEDPSIGERITIRFGEGEGERSNSYIIQLVKKGTSLNLLDCEVEGQMAKPAHIVLEPDYIMDITSVASCITDNGRSHLIYIINRFKERTNSQAALLGDFAGDALDDIISTGKGEGHDFVKTLWRSFSSQALRFCACKGFDPGKFKEMAMNQDRNIKGMVGLLFGEDEEKRKRAILEPSFICEALGLQGRVDLMTVDGKMIVEQKSGWDMSLEKDGKRAMPRAAHKAQLIMYIGILCWNFGIKPDSDITPFLMYSKYEGERGLDNITYNPELLSEIIETRNRMVAAEIKWATEGLESFMEDLDPEKMFSSFNRTRFFETHILPEYKKIWDCLRNLPRMEKAYLCRMTRFVCRESMEGRLAEEGLPENQASSSWRLSLKEKRENGDIYIGLEIEEMVQTKGDGIYDEIVLKVPQDDNFTPNFRRGDMINLYSYPPESEPDITRSIIHKGTLKEIRPEHITVSLTNGQHNRDVFTFHSDIFAVEHAWSDLTTSNSIRGIFTLVTAPETKRQILLGQRRPRYDITAKLSRSYNPEYDEAVLGAKRANDYFLIVGPPGTGKTSMAMRFVTEELLTDPDACLLITAYTNRAVDEICGMLEDANLDYIRMGNPNSCDPRFGKKLLTNLSEDGVKLEEIRKLIDKCRIFVATTTMLQSKPFIFELKHFSAAIVDEASQIIEPAIVGILAGHRDGRCFIDKFILIGDHKQLPAVVRQEADVSSVRDNPLLEGIGISNCRDSLFHRLLRSETKAKDNKFVATLSRQGRMHPEVARLPLGMFYAKEALKPVPLPHQLEEDLGYEAIPKDSFDCQLIVHRLIFIPSSGDDEKGISDKANEDEARIAASVARRIARLLGDKYDKDKSIGIIVPYRNQISLIRSKMDALRFTEKYGEISIDTVERYQGSQRDVIIFSFTVKHDYQLDFLTSNTFQEDGYVIDRKLNVALTRARKQLIITGNPKIIGKNPIFSRMISECFWLK